MDRIDLDRLFPIQPKICPKCKFPTALGKPFCERCNFDLLHGSVKKKKYRNSESCIYCKSKDLTKEHLFPDWLSQVYPRRFAHTLHFISRPEKDISGHQIDSDLKADSHPGDPYTRGVYNVCKNCNNRWMSDLQNEAKPSIIKLANGNWDALTDEECEVLARWALMQSINFECYGRHLITCEEHRNILKNGKIPSGCRVYIGRMQDETCAGYSFFRPMVLRGIPQAENILPITFTYFCIERIVFFVVITLDDKFFPMISNGGMIPDDGLGLPPDGHLPLRRIWPENLETVEPQLKNNSALKPVNLIIMEGMFLGGISKLGKQQLQNLWGIYISD